MIVEYKGDKLNINLIDEGSGECVLLLHGWGARASIYTSVINPLVSSYRIIAPDLPGFGDSDEPSFAYSIEDYSGFVCELMRTLGIKKAHVIGHSHGGRVTLQLLTGECDFEIGKVVLLDSAGIPPKKSIKKEMKIKTYKTLKKFVTLSLIKKIYPTALEDLKKKFGSADYASSSEIMRASMVKVLPCDYTKKLCEIRNPTLLIWGEQDTATPISNALLMQKEIPDCGLVKIPNGSHFAFAEFPDLTKRVLRSFFNIK